MAGFNLCEAFFSGYYFFREEFASCLLGYLLSPFSTGKTVALQRFLKLLQSADSKYAPELARAAAELAEMKSFPEHFAENPLEEKYPFATALEFEHIDILIRINRTLIIVENKIYPCSVGNLPEQIKGYAELFDSETYTVVPVALVPPGGVANYGENIIAIPWLEPDSPDICSFLSEMSNDIEGLDQFIAFLKSNFQTASRPNPVVRKSELLKFIDPDIVKIICNDDIFDSYDIGRDKASIASIIQILRGESCVIYPFRVVGRKCYINVIKNPKFLCGKNFDGKHNIRDLIKAVLEKHGYEITDYNFDCNEIARNPAGFTECKKLLLEIMNRNDFDFCAKYDEITGGGAGTADSLCRRIKELAAALSPGDIVQTPELGRKVLSELEHAVSGK